MDAIDYPAVVTQLQLENEMLRHRMKYLLQVSETIYQVQSLLENLWQKVMANKTQFIMALMIVYWVLSIGLILYDRIKGY